MTDTTATDVHTDEMTDPGNTSAATELPPADTDTTTEPDTPDNATEDHEDTETDTTTGNREAAKWRKRFREQETETKTLADRLEAMQRQHVEAIAATAGVKAAALWATAELSDLLADDGTVSVDNVRQAIRTAEESLGLRLGLHVEPEGYAPADPGKPNARQQWDAAFRPNVQQR
jgi:hypothetical protein